MIHQQLALNQTIAFTHPLHQKIDSITFRVVFVVTIKVTMIKRNIKPLNVSVDCITTFKNDSEIKDSSFSISTPMDRNGQLSANDNKDKTQAVSFRKSMNCNIYRIHLKHIRLGMYGHIDGFHQTIIILVRNEQERTSE